MRLAFLLLVLAVVSVATPDPSAAPEKTPTFAADIAPLIYTNCAGCHRPGQAGPFSLLSYDDVKTHADGIVEATSKREMPPWRATRASGFPEYRDERRLSDDQIDTIKKWVEGGMPAGNMKTAPKPPVFRYGWALGVPDVILTLPKPIQIPAKGPDQYRNVTLTIDYPDDRWITAIDFEPSARAVVHHALFFVSPADAIVKDDEVVPGLARLAGRGLAGGGRASTADESWGGLGGWVPGVTPRFYPDGIAQPFQKHSNLVVQLHLHPNGTAATEDGRLALYFTKTPPLKSLTGIQVPPAFGFAAGIDIPAGEKRFVVHDTFELPIGVEAYGARGHAHYLCREMKMTATLPNGSKRGVLWISDWDFGWQDSYYFKSPMRLPKGTKIDVDIVYDNSDGNSANPHSPPARVTWGRESTDEMGSMTLLVTAPTGDESQTLRTAQAQHFRQQLLRRR